MAKKRTFQPIPIAGPGPLAGAGRPLSRKPTFTERELLAIRKELRSFNVHLERMEKRMATQTEILERSLREQQESRAATERLLVGAQQLLAENAKLPEIIKAAVAEALAKNPGADLSALDAAADEADAQQARANEISAAIEAALAPPVPPEPPAPVEEEIKED